MTGRTKRLIFVVGAGGAPLEYVLPRLAALAEVHAYQATPVLSPVKRALLERWCADVVAPDLADRSAGIVADLVQTARRRGADGILGMSELAVILVAEACLALDLPGPGPDARYARDKWLMRSRWAEAGVPGPRFTRVDDLASLETARRTLKTPFLLKPSGRGGGIGQQVVDDSTSDLARVLRDLKASLASAQSQGIVEYTSAMPEDHCVAEEIIGSTTESWYDGRDSDYVWGDYLSVEGIVARGVYHPVSITARMPTLANFAETVALSPTVLPERLQRKVERMAADAVDALRLDTCGTHTEIKLMANEQMCMLESSARFGGVTATTMVEHVFGIDLISLLAAEALGEPQKYPDRMLTGGRGAAATVYLFGADSRSRPWSAPVPFRWEQLDWQALVSPASRVEVIASQMAPDGTVVQPYQPGGGTLNNAGTVLVHSIDAETALADSYRMVDNLEAALIAAGQR